MDENVFDNSSMGPYVKFNKTVFFPELEREETSLIINYSEFTEEEKEELKT